MTWNTAHPLGCRKQTRAERLSMSQLRRRFSRRNSLAVTPARNCFREIDASAFAQRCPELLCDLLGAGHSSCSRYSHGTEREEPGPRVVGETRRAHPWVQSCHLDVMNDVFFCAMDSSGPPCTIRSTSSLNVVDGFLEVRQNDV